MAGSDRSSGRCSARSASRQADRRAIGRCADPPRIGRTTAILTENRLRFSTPRNQDASVSWIVDTGRNDCSTWNNPAFVQCSTWNTHAQARRDASCRDCRSTRDGDFSTKATPDLRFQIWLPARRNRHAFCTLSDCQPGNSGHFPQLFVFLHKSRHYPPLAQRSYSGLPWERFLVS